MKKRVIGTFIVIATITGLMMLQGCGSNDSDDASKKPTAAFKVQLSSSLPFMSMNQINSFAAPTSLTARLGGVDILRDCTNGNPPGDCNTSERDPDPDIWVNAGCNNDIAQCTVGNTEAFELAVPTAANEELNSQGRSIETGTFTHVRIYFLLDGITCNGSDLVNVGAAFPIVFPLATPLTVSEGESITITLNYDPSTVSNCSESDVQSMFANMTATAIKQ